MLPPRVTATPGPNKLLPMVAAAQQMSPIVKSEMLPDLQRPTGAVHSECSLAPLAPLAQRHFLTLPQKRSERLPAWFKVKPQTGPSYLRIRQQIQSMNLHTVCEEARCPNIWECWNAGTATFMILGDICTRSCGFCSVTFGKPQAVDKEEPYRLAQAVATLKIQHVVITSVNRDELEDGGASIFKEAIIQIRKISPGCTVEVLIPDFQGNKKALENVLLAQPDILAHNIETVPRLYRTVRPQAKYERSLNVLSWAKTRGFRTKTGMMLGLGESVSEVRAVMYDLVKIGCDIVTFGQYLQPTERHLPIVRFVSPDEFEQLKKEGKAIGLGHIEAGPLVRSSYHAERHVQKRVECPVYPT